MNTQKKQHRLQRKKKALSYHSPVAQKEIQKFKKQISLKNNNITTYKEILNKLQHNLTNEIEIAKRVQHGLFPHSETSYENLEIASRFVPSEQISGDMYDIITKKETKTVLFIVDVSGHGICSALIGMMTKMLIIHYSKHCDRPSEIFQKVNNDICQYLHTGLYITAFIGIIDHSDNTMIYSQAGQAGAILFENSTQSIKIIEGNSILIGHSALSDASEYNDDILPFQWNDKLILFTDGILESKNPSDKLYGNKYIISSIKKYGTHSPEYVLSKIINHNNRFRKNVPLDDEYILLVLQFGCSKEIILESGFDISEHPEMITVYTHDQIEDVCTIIKSKLDQKGYFHNEIFKAHQVLYELLDNAIKHGNKFNPDKKVILLYKITLSYYAFSIIDEGIGFDFSILDTVITPQNVFKSTGKGFIIIYNFMDEIQFNKKGNRILVKKYIQMLNDYNGETSMQQRCNYGNKK